MLNNDNFFLKSKTYKYFEKNLLKDKNKRDLLVSFEELLNIKKHIRNIYKTDDPEDIKKLIGQNIKNLIVKEKDYEYALLINNKYKEIYEKCKFFLDELKK